MIITTIDNQVLSENEGYNKLALSGTISDYNVGNNLIVKYSIEDDTGTLISDHNNRIIQDAIISDGTVQFFSDLIIDIDSKIPEGINVIKIWVEDDKGGKSSEVIRTFTIDKTGPTVICTKKITISLMSLLEIDIRAIDPSNPLNDVSITNRITDSHHNEVKIPNISNIFIHPDTHNAFTEGNLIIVYITATDAIGNKTHSSIQIMIDSKGDTRPNDL